MNIFISGADRGLGFGLTKKLLEVGHIVFAGQYLHSCDELETLGKTFKNQLHIIPLDVSDTESVLNARELVYKTTEKLDVLISNAGIFEKTTEHDDMNTDYHDMMNIYNVNAIGGVRLIETFMEMLKKSEERRICLVSSEAGSITSAERTNCYSYCMSKAALNMYGKLLHNRLNQAGYRIKLYHPGWIKSYMSGELSTVGDLSIEEATDYAIEYFFQDETEESIFAMHGYNGEVFKF